VCSLRVVAGAELTPLVTTLTQVLRVPAVCGAPHHDDAEGRHLREFPPLSLCSRPVMCVSPFAHALIALVFSATVAVAAGAPTASALAPGRSRRAPAGVPGALLSPSNTLALNRTHSLAGK
jgi:hypothetical protein